MTPGFDQIVQKSFVTYLYPHLTLSPPDRMMGQSYLDYLNLLHAQGVTLKDAGKSGLVQNEQSLEWSLLLEGQQSLKKDWGVESTANWVQVHLPAFETWYFPFVSFSTSFCWRFLATSRWCCRLRFKGYLCDFSLLLIFCYLLNLNEIRAERKRKSNRLLIKLWNFSRMTF